MARKVTLLHPGMAELLNSAEVRAEITARMQPALQAAINDPHDDTYAYENGLHLEQGTTDRAVVHLVSGDFKGYILEAEYGILSRALDAAGGERST